MANIQGTNLAAAIAPFTTDDTYATHDSQYGKGGWHEVLTIAERDAIPEDRKRNGMAVFVVEEKKVYTLESDGSWTEFKTGPEGPIVSSVNGDTGDVIVKAVQNQKDNSTMIKSWVGTQEEYNAISEKDPNTLYFIKKDGQTVDIYELIEGKQNKLVAGDGITLTDGVDEEGKDITNIVNSKPNVQADWNAESGDAAILNKPTIPVLPENITTQGNEFNTAGKLVQLDGTGKLPAIDGSQLTGIMGSLPIASDSVLGGIKVGSGLSITEDGTLSAEDSGSLSYRGEWSETETYKIGEIVSKGDYLFISQIDNNTGNSPIASGWSDSNWGTFTNDGKVMLYALETIPSKDIPLIFSESYNGNYDRLKVGCIQNGPKMNNETGQLKVPGGIEGYYTSTEVDEKIAEAGGANIDIATSDKAGIVKSSTDNLKIAVAQDGTMSVNGLETSLNGKLTADKLIAGANITLTKNDQTGTVTIASIGGGSSVDMTNYYTKSESDNEFGSKAAEHTHANKTSILDLFTLDNGVLKWDGNVVPVNPGQVEKTATGAKSGEVFNITTICTEENIKALINGYLFVNNTLAATPDLEEGVEDPNTATVQIYNGTVLMDTIKIAPSENRTYQLPNLKGIKVSINGTVDATLSLVGYIY